MSPDPWSAFLGWLTTVMVPNWGELIGLLPYLVIVGIIGPLVTLIALLWVWYLVHRTRGHVRRAEVQAITAPLGADGAPAYPANVPYCEDHALLFPARATTCQVDRADLRVRCAVDGTVRAASVEVCPSCGTRYVLGASASPLAIVSRGGPPPGGAAVA